MTRDEFERWYRGTCPGGEGHAKDDALPDAWRGDCAECVWELLQAEMGKERERCVEIVRRFRTGAEESKTLFARAKDDKMTLYCGGAFLALSDALTKIESGETA